MKAIIINTNGGKIALFPIYVNGKIVNVNEVYIPCQFKIIEG